MIWMSFSEGQINSLFQCSNYKKAITHFLQLAWDRDEFGWRASDVASVHSSSIVLCFFCVTAWAAHFDMVIIPVAHHLITEVSIVAITSSHEGSGFVLDRQRRLVVKELLLRAGPAQCALLLPETAGGRQGFAKPGTEVTDSAAVAFLVSASRDKAADRAHGACGWGARYRLALLNIDTGLWVIRGHGQCLNQSHGDCAPNVHTLQRQKERNYQNQCRNI